MLNKGESFFPLGQTDVGVEILENGRVKVHLGQREFEYGAPVIICRPKDSSRAVQLRTDFKPWSAKTGFDIVRKSTGDKRFTVVDRIAVVSPKRFAEGRSQVRRTIVVEARTDFDPSALEMRVDVPVISDQEHSLESLVRGDFELSERSPAILASSWRSFMRGSRGVPSQAGFELTAGTRPREIGNDALTGVYLG